MSVHDDLLDTERASWVALSTSGRAAAEFFDASLADDVLVLLPGGTVIDDRAAGVQSMQGVPWTGFELSDERVTPLGSDVAVVSYRAKASREGGDYEALFNSTYVRRDGAWRLALHQQTPV